MRKSLIHRLIQFPKIIAIPKRLSIMVTSAREKLAGRQTPTKGNDMKYELSKGLVLTDERPESSYGIPVLVADGVAYGKGDTMPQPWGAAGYDEYGNHTGNGNDCCRQAGVIVKSFVGSIQVGEMSVATFAWIKSFYDENAASQFLPDDNSPRLTIFED